MAHVRRFGLSEEFCKHRMPRVPMATNIEELLSWLEPWIEWLPKILHDTKAVSHIKMQLQQTAS